jgi:hypothetical protein
MLFEWFCNWVLRLRRRGVEKSTLYATRGGTFFSTHRKWVALTGRTRNEL